MPEINARFWEKPSQKFRKRLFKISMFASYLSRWWFQTFFKLIPIWGNDPIWLIFFKGVETTNQFILPSKQTQPLGTGRSTVQSGNFMVEFFSYVSLPPDQRNPISCESIWIHICLILIFFIYNWETGLWFIFACVCMYFSYMYMSIYIYYICMFF